MNTSYFVHEKSIVESETIGVGTRIWAFTHVLDGARIGTQCNIGGGCYIESHALIGNNVIIKNNISIWDKVTIEDDCFFGPNVVLTHVTNPRARMKRSLDEFAQTFIKKGVTIGANATIVCGITIGRHAFIGAGAVVTGDIPAYALAYGNPARINGYMCECGEKIDFSRSCNCGRTYRYAEEHGCSLE